MKKRIVILIVIIVCICLGIGIFAFINSLKKDQEKVKGKMKEINANFETFTLQIDTFNAKREELAEIIGSEDVYYANFYANSAKINQILEDYNKITNEINTGNDYLKDNCSNYYPDSEINNECEIFNSSYASIVEVFKKDIASYNETVKKYNEWTKTNSTFKTVSEYVIKEV